MTDPDYNEGRRQIDAQHERNNEGSRHRKNLEHWSADMLVDIDSKLDKVLDAQTPPDSARFPTSARVPEGPLPQALFDHLTTVGVDDETAADIADAAADLIEDYADEAGSSATEQDLADAVRSVRSRPGTDLSTLTRRIRRAIKKAVAPDGDDHDALLDQAMELLLSAFDRARDNHGSGASVQATGMASSEVIRDASHLTTLLLGSSPAFSEAMRMQSDAMASSLAAFNKVSDAQRHDGLNLAILARSADAAFNRGG